MKLPVVYRMAALISGVIFVLLGFAPTEAQPAAGPILLNIEGDLWAWDTADQPLVQLTDWGLNSTPVLSPDGTRAAYSSGATIFKNWLATVNGAGGFTPPQNIWILDLPSRQTFRIADQPIDAVWNGPVEAGKYTLRSAPTWSPDGLQLAWMELLIQPLAFTDNQEVNTAQLVIYDLVNRTTRILDSYTPPNSQSNIDIYNVSWGRPGIALTILLRNDNPAWELRLYDPLSGTRITETQTERIFPGVWIEDQAQDHLFEGNSSEMLIDWQSGEPEPMPRQPEMYSLTSPDGASFFVSDDDWTLVLPGQAPIALGDQVRPFGISRDGQSAVYGQWELNPATGFYAYTLVIHTHSQMIEIGSYQNIKLQWGPVGWRIRR